MRKGRNYTLGLGVLGSNIRSGSSEGTKRDPAQPDRSSGIVILFWPLKLFTNRPRQSWLIYRMPQLRYRRLLNLSLVVFWLVLNPFSQYGSFYLEHVLLLALEDIPGCNKVGLALLYRLRSLRTSAGMAAPLFLPLVLDEPLFPFDSVVVF